MISSEDYEEIYEILSYMDKIVVMKIPIEILSIINKKRNKEYVTKIDKNDLFNLNNMSENTQSVLAWLDVNYWINPDKKRKLIQKMNLEKQKQELLKQQQYSSNVFENKNKKTEYNNFKANSTLVVIDKKENFIQKLIKKIKFIFKTLVI